MKTERWHQKLTWWKCVTLVSGKYPAVPIDVNGRVLEVPGPSVGGDSGWNRQSRGLVVGFVPVELSCVILFIICLSVVIWAWRVSRLALNLCSIRSGGTQYWLRHFVRPWLFRMLHFVVLRAPTCLDGFSKRTSCHFWGMYARGKSSYNRRKNK